MYTFDEIIGNEEIITHFQKGIKLGRVSHAYIIQGEKGMGKKLLANTLAKALQCEEKEDVPCGRCLSCRLFDTANHPDIIYVKSSKIKSIGVDDIRQQINRDIHIKPYKYPYKIYIIDEAEKLTEEAQNAMLKTIEEPPNYVIIFLLTTNKYSFLPTILSRCLLFDLKPVKEEDIRDYLKIHYEMPHEKAGLYVAFARGNIGRAKMLVESERFNEMREHCLGILKAMEDMSVIDILDQGKQLDIYKDQMDDVLDIFLTWFRDMLIVKATQEEEGLILREGYKYLLKLSRLLTYNKIGENIKYIESTKHKLKYNVNFQLSLETLLLKIKES